jgi:hypothetical protein
MKKALKQLGLHKFERKRVDTKEGDILRIDRNGKITRAQFEPKIYRSKYMSWYDYDDSKFYNMHEEMLLAYCGCYGVDSSDVELLLEYGYTCDEIEDMLVDHRLLHEALRDVKYMYGDDIYEGCYGGPFDGQDRVYPRIDRTSGDCPSGSYHGAISGGTCLCREDVW